MVTEVDYYTRGMEVSLLVWIILKIERWGEGVVIKQN